MGLLAGSLFINLIQSMDGIFTILGVNDSDPEKPSKKRILFLLLGAAFFFFFWIGIFIWD